MKRIGTRIVLAVLFCSIIMSLLLGGFSTIRIISVIRKESKENLLQLTRVYGKTLDELLVSYEVTGSTIHDTVIGTIDESRIYETGYLEEYSDTVLRPILEQTISKLEKVEGIFVIFDPSQFGKTEGIWIGKDNDKVTYSNPEEMLKNDENPLAKLYYTGLNAGKAMWSDFYENFAGSNVMTYFIPIERNNIPIAVVGIDIRVDDIVNTIKEIVAFRSGYAFMLNKDYDYVIHPTLDRNSNLRTIKDGEVDYIAEELDSKEYGILDAKYDGEKKVMTFFRLIDDKVIMLAVPRYELMRELYITINVIIGVIIGTTILAVIFALLTGRQISKPITLVTDILKKTSELDLRNLEETDEIKALLDRKDEIGDIFRASESLRREMRSVIEAIEETTSIIGANANSLSNAAYETMKSINDVAKTIDELAEASLGQAEDAERGSIVLGKLADEIKLAVENGELVIESSMKTQNINEASSKSLEDMMEKFMISKESTNMVAKNVNSLLEKSKFIGNILNTILNISEKQIY